MVVQAPSKQMFSCLWDTYREGTVLESQLFLASACRIAGMVIGVCLKAVQANPDPLRSIGFKTPNEKEVWGEMATYQETSSLFVFILLRNINK